MFEKIDTIDPKLSNKLLSDKIQYVQCPKGHHCSGSNAGINHHIRGSWGSGGKWESKTVKSKCKYYLFCRPKPDKAHLGRIESIANANGSHIVERRRRRRRRKKKRQNRVFPRGWPKLLRPPVLRIRWTLWCSTPHIYSLPSTFHLFVHHVFPLRRCPQDVLGREDCCCRDRSRDDLRHVQPVCWKTYSIFKRCISIQKPARLQKPHSNASSNYLYPENILTCSRRES
jgi:hypothetical protein